MKPTCPERLSSAPLFPVLREVPAPARDRAVPTQVICRVPGEFELPADRLWSTTPSAGMQIHCATGQLWVTQAGNPEDVILLAGETFTPAPKGRVVIQALTNARIAVSR